MSQSRTVASALLAVMIIVMIPVGFFAAKSEPAQAQADLVSCKQEGKSIVCRLLDNTVVLRVPIPTVRIPGPTIRVPGPTVRPPRATVRVPGRSRTVRVPGPTKTVRIPSGTETVTVRPNNPQPSRLPGETQTITAEPTGQSTTGRATVTPSPEVVTRTETETRTKTETIVRNALFGTLAILALIGLGLLALWIGYLLGYKSAERHEARSMRNLLDSIKFGKRS